MTLMTDPNTPTSSFNKEGTELTANMEIRMEMILSINESRKANGVSELPDNEALMNAISTLLTTGSTPQTMIGLRCDCIGMEMTQYDGITYCYMFVGILNSVNIYA